MATLKQTAKDNLKRHLVDNPCRGIALGLSETGAQMQISWIMGRSENSQNRVYVVKDGIMKTEAFDPSKVRDPSLIIYNVMRSIDRVHVASNGDQTDTVCDSLYHLATSWGLHGQGVMNQFFSSLGKRYCEPDAPNFTPRITGYQDSTDLFSVGLSVLRAEPFARESWIETEAEIKAGNAVQVHSYDKNSFPTIRNEFTRVVAPGFGYMITTYMPGSKELPSFQGEPILVPMHGNLEDSLEDVMQGFWSLLEPSFRVAVGGREITPAGVRYAAPINRFPEKK